MNVVVKNVLRYAVPTGAMDEKDWELYNETYLLCIYEKIKYYSEMGLFLFDKPEFTFPEFVKFASRFSTKQKPKYLPAVYELDEDEDYSVSDMNEDDSFLTGTAKEDSKEKKPRERTTTSC